MAATAAGAATATATTTNNNNNVSVTAINVDSTAYYSLAPPGKTEPPDAADSGSDSEVAQIDFHNGVNMRHKKGDIKVQEVPRPMSWEGELSDGESGNGGMMCVDEDSSHMHPVNNAQPTTTTITSGGIMSHLSSGHHLHQHQPHHHQSMPENLSTCTVTGPPRQQTTLSLAGSPAAVRLKQQTAAAGGGASLHSTPSHSPLMSQRPLRQLNVPATPSPDSAVHSAYSVFSSPTQSPLTQRHITLTPSLSRNNSDASHSSCCSYSSVSVSVSPTQQFSPTHSPIQGRHIPQMHGSPLHHNVIYRSVPDVDHAGLYRQASLPQPDELLNGEHDNGSQQLEDNDDKTGIVPTVLPTGQGISRQQLINSPCPICGDKISGFHYGIFSCESCKGFFKRTVQNRKNYVCLRGALCPVTVATRKKCPACRFDKCLQCGMKLEAIREDRTRGGRSTYQCSYNVPTSLTSSNDLQGGAGVLGGASVKLEPAEPSPTSTMPNAQRRLAVPSLLQEIMDVEHLWHYNELELNKLSVDGTLGNCKPGSSSSSFSLTTNTLLGGLASSASASDSNPDFLANLCNIADHRLYKIVKWCKSLPLFKNISIDDQICLLINSWCELLLFSCCFRSMSTPGEIKISLGKSINLAQAREMGLQACIERMLNFTEHLRRLRVDKYEYVAMKVIVLLTSDTSELREVEKVRASQEKALQALQAYTLAHYPDSPAKFGELLLRIPELQRTCQVGKEMLSIKSKEGEGPSFNLLMELLRGDH